MNQDDVGKFFTTDGDDIWMMISYYKDPTATMKNLQTGEIIGGPIGCLNLQPFIKLNAGGEIPDAD